MGTKNLLKKPSSIKSSTPEDKVSVREKRLLKKIDELTRKLDQLKHIEKDYREVMEWATEAIFKVDPQGFFFFISGEFNRLLGYTLDDLGGKHFTYIVHPDDQAICLEAFGELLANGKARENLVFQVRHKDGSFRWVDCSAICLFNQQNEPTYCLGFAHNFTQIQSLVENLKQSEKALLLSEERYHSLFDALSEGIVMMDKTGSILTCNRSAEIIFNTTREQIVGYQPLSGANNFVHEDGSVFPADLHPAYVTLRTGEQQKDVVLGIMYTNAPTKWISINTTPVYYSEGPCPPDAVVVSFNDITQAKHYKEELRLNQQVLELEKVVLELNARPAITLREVADYFLRGLETIFPGMHCSLLTLDPDGERMMMLSAPGLPDEFTKAIDGCVIGPNAATSGTAMFLKETVITENIYLDPKWKKHIALAEQFGFKSSWSFPIINHANEVLATVSAYHTYPAIPETREYDIFDRVRNLLRILIENKRAEAEVKESNEMYLHATRAMAQAVIDAQEKERADIGYELHDNVNQILSTSKLFLELARTDENQRLDLISRSAEGIANALTEIRNISRSLVPASIGDLGLIASIEDLAENIRFTRTLKVEFYHEGEIEKLIPEKIKLVIFRIIQEQLTNVLKHAEATSIFIELLVDSELVHLFVSDDGKGFDTEKVKTKKGVGLKNIANRVELVNGKITMKATPGKGCKLRINIPV